jgi:hypothetical protein
MVISQYIPSQQVACNHAALVLKRLRSTQPLFQPAPAHNRYSAAGLKAFCDYLGVTAPLACQPAGFAIHFGLLPNGYDLCPDHRGRCRRKTRDHQRKARTRKSRDVVDL